MEKSVFELIQKKIAVVSDKALKAFTANVKPDVSAQLFRMGFSSSSSIVNANAKLDPTEVTRAQLIQYFGCKVLSETEVEALEAKFNLQSHEAKRFKDAIPLQNQNEIMAFVEYIKKERLNQGRLETDCYHIPLTTPFLVTAPPEMFRKALNVQEMSKAEYKKWLDEDPIVWKRIYKFDPFNSDNEPTKWLAMVTAWGLEAVLVNTN